MAETAPEYLICLECETPCYSFEWDGGALTEALCTMCGNDDLDAFMTEEDFEVMSASDH